MINRWLCNINMGNLPHLRLSYEQGDYFPDSVTIQFWIEWLDSAYMLNHAIAPWRRPDDDIPF